MKNDWEIGKFKSKVKQRSMLGRSYLHGNVNENFRQYFVFKLFVMGIGNPFSPFIPIYSYIVHQGKAFKISACNFHLVFEDGLLCQFDSFKLLSLTKPLKFFAGQDLITSFHTYIIYWHKILKLHQHTPWLSAFCSLCNPSISTFLSLLLHNQCIILLNLQHSKP